MLEQATLTPSKTRNQPVQGQWTYEDYLQLPDDGKRYEIIHGVLYVANAPTFAHQFTVGEIFAELRQFVKANQLGQVLMAPFEVHLSEKTRPIQPDVLFVESEKWPTTEEVKKFEGIPGLVVEVISPSSVRTDRVIKFHAYEDACVPEYWIVNPKLRAVEVYTFSNGEYALLDEFFGDDEIKSAVLEGLTIVNSTLFLPYH